MRLLALPAFALVLTLLAPAALAQGADFQFTDPRGDVTMGGGEDAYAGKGAAALDVTMVRLTESGSDLIIELWLADLSTASSRLGEPGYSIQYAVGFITPGSSEGWEARALYGGREYTGESGGSWRWQMHDIDADKWPSADGRASGNKLIWTIPRTQIEVTEGATLTDWHVNTWASGDDFEQYGDRAQTTGTYTLGAGQTGADGDDTANEGEPRLLPGPALPLVVGLLPLVGTRLRRHE